MKTFPDSRSRGRLVAALAAALVLLVLAGVGVYGLLTGRTQPSASPSPASSPSQAGPSASASPSAAKPPTVQRSTDPDVFARNVATALFGWDTGVGLWPVDYTSPILTVDDPTGAEQAGLASDVAAYLPSREQWIQLRKHATRQSLTITRTYVPAAWAQAVQQATAGQLPDGATAITIEGTRHRAGTWDGRPVREDFAVTFTVFLACPPNADSCHVLRLSQLDNPLK
ncbi:hypothetical protein [Bifidobacterium psychraerophilum]|uniref:Uncharacterized protein n=1 Tax=Bifidobacterium psychraerophilum TaxID=218140 RepID=A0A087CF81_9BIFI|nr:hypothetical protein [Bifidobacterium psychraerophilum]KFI81931.1 hypothetical protein BPSY_0779 [Bifidobacterium psychraerophilum]PKA94737.1 hypothetical protein A9A89_0962 [Bifidobacterium psychraerophilum DSM 22366]